MDMKFVRRNWRSINETPIKRAGLLVRTIMRGSIRRAHVSKKTGAISGKPSPPGKPPKARTGIRPNVPGQAPKTQSKNLPFKKILSIPFDGDTKAVIGHQLMPIKKQDPRITPMQAHERGKRVRIKTEPKSRQNQIGGKAFSEKQRKAARKKFKEGRIKRKKVKRVRKRVKMPKRPFAFPALKKAKTKIGQFWRGRINKSTVKTRKLWSRI
jgi:hypothetical protein